MHFNNEDVLSNKGEVVGGGSLDENIAMETIKNSILKISKLNNTNQK